MRNEASRPFGLGKDGPYGGCDDAPAPRTLGGLASRGGGLHAFFPHPTTGRVVLMRRILRVMTVALVMAAVLVAMAAPAFAAPGDNKSRVEILAGGGGADFANSNFLSLTNPQSDLIVVHHTQNVHGSGDPLVNNCNTNKVTKGNEELPCTQH
jgi:hypothetical protein